VSLLRDAWAVVALPNRTKPPSGWWRRNDVEVAAMRRTALVLSIAFVVAGVPPSDMAAAAAASPVGQQLAGTWHGSFAQVSGGSERDEADCVLKVKEDGTFTAQCSRSEPLRGGVSKAFGWSGRVVRQRGRFILKTTDGPWPSTALTQSGSDRLSALTRDPQMETFVLMDFERAANAP